MTVVNPDALGFQIHNADTTGGADAAGGGMYENYFGFETTEKYFLPDGKQWIAFKPMNEGARAAYEEKTMKDITLNRRTDDAKVRVNAANDRHALIVDSVCDWGLMQPDVSTGEWRVVPFSKGRGGTFEQWLLRANPKIVNELFRAIQNANPWMIAEQDPKQIREEIARLEEMLKEAERREEDRKNS